MSVGNWLLAQNDGGGAAAAVGGAVGFLVYLALIVAWLAGMWKAFAKAGKPGFAAIIPVYQQIIWLELAGKPIWWIILMVFVPCVNLVILIIVLIEVAKAYGKGAGFGIGLLLLPFIFWPILGFGDARYVGAPMQSEI